VKIGWGVDRAVCLDVGARRIQMPVDRAYVARDTVRRRRVRDACYIDFRRDQIVYVVVEYFTNTPPPFIPGDGG